MTFRGWVIASGVVAGVLGVVNVFGTVYGMLLGQPVDVIRFVGISICFFGWAAAAVKFESGDVSPRIVIERDGTTFRPDRALDVPTHVAFLGAAVLVVDAAMSPGDGWPHWAPHWFSAPLPSVVAAVGVLGVVQLVWRFVRWGAGKRLRLTPDGLELGEGLRPKSRSWEQIRCVSDKPPWAWQRSPSSVVLKMSDGKEFRMTTGTVTSNPSALRDLVEFYWQNPQVRGELIHGGAERRFEQYANRLTRPGEHA